MRPLFLTLNRWLGYTFEWGVRDCCLAPCEWVVERTGKDPAADLRGMYSSAIECQRVTGFFTDPIALLQPRLSEIGLDRTDCPSHGDFGVIRVADGGRMHPMGALYVGDGLWGVLAQQGAAIIPAIEMVAVWRVP